MEEKLKVVTSSFIVPRLRYYKEILQFISTRRCLQMRNNQAPGYTALLHYHHIKDVIEKSGSELHTEGGKLICKFC